MLLCPTNSEPRLARFLFATRSALLTGALLLGGCASQDRDHLVRISIPDQKMIVTKQGVEVAHYDVSTSKFGVGTRPGSFATPLGKMEIAKKVGGTAPPGMKFHCQRATGEIVRPNSPGRDPIVSRILCLRGLEQQNRNTMKRSIYIHGTAEEWRIGTPASYGCIRMRSKDVIDLFARLGVGAQVEVTMSPFATPAIPDPKITEESPKTAEVTDQVQAPPPPLPAPPEIEGKKRVRSHRS